MNAMRNATQRDDSTRRKRHTSNYPRGHEGTDDTSLSLPADDVADIEHDGDAPYADDGDGIALNTDRDGGDTPYAEVTP
jgi:hypothetical protein